MNVEIDGARLHYVDRGSGPPVVLVHGLAGVLQNFTHSLTGALEGSFRVIGLDRPGAGFSVRRRGASAHLPAQAGVIARFIERLGIERPIVVGHSLGGAIALALALDHPQLARALALIAPLTQPQREVPPAFAGLKIPSARERALVAWTIAVPLSLLGARAALKQIFAPEDVPKDFLTAGGAWTGLRPWQFYSASTDMMASLEDMPNLVARYHELEVPVHVLYGSDDRVLDAQLHGEGLRAQIPAADVEIVSGGHMLPVTQPSLVAKWIERIAATA